MMSHEPCCRVMLRLFGVPVAALLLVVVPLLLLAAALTAQYGFHHPPCELCIWQRIAYGVLAGVAALVWCLRRHPKAARIALVGAALVALTGAGIAFFHVGVQQHWWSGTDSCALQPLNATTDSKNLVEALLATPPARCDRIDLTILGIALPAWNVLAFLGLGVFALLVALMPCLPCSEKAKP